MFVASELLETLRTDSKAIAIC